MDSRRGVLKKLLVGTATAAAVPGTASAALDAVNKGAAGMGLSLPAGPAPWWLINPIGLGTPLKYGWYVAGMSGVERGAAVVTLAHATGRKAQVHLCAHNGAPKGLAHTKLIDVVLMDGGSGSFRTDEKLGRVVLGLADRIRANEASEAGDLSPIAKMMTHDARVQTFGPETLV